MRALLTLLLAIGLSVDAAAQRRPVTVEDQFRFKDVGNPEISPDGEWILYTLTTTDVAADKRNSDVWKVKWDGSQRAQLTFTTDNETAPRWSPDGKYISFLSSRPGPVRGNQVWVLDRLGGEARQLTKLRGGVTSYEWSPDASRLVVVKRHGDDSTEEPPEGEGRGGGSASRNLKPIVIDKYQFKRDGQTYLTGNARNRIFIFDVASGKAELLTADQDANGGYDESEPAWSPDGTRIAFVSNHDDNWDRTRNSDVFVTDAKPGSTSRKLTTFAGTDGNGGLAWSPDGKLIAYAQGSEPKFNFHSLARLAIVPADGGPPRVLTEALDRGVSVATFVDDGKNILVTVTDDRTVYLAKVPASGGPVQRIVSGPRVIGQPSHAKGHIVATSAASIEPGELYAVDGGGLRKLTTHNEAVASELQLQPAEDVAFKSKDGTEIHGLLTKPIGYVSGRRYPTLVRIHGGPTAQDAHSFAFERQIFAANGYAVVNVNYRGSSGRSAKFSESIFADWGNLEVADVLAAVDYLVSAGIADADRLGIGGWSYGGLLTDYVIASDTRFKAAISGAGSANHISLYGHDQYTFLYDNEFGPPWKNLDLWIKFSYPFFKADRITTPTLFMGGQDDFNVPILGSEQMYQALKTMNVPTQLVVYPEQNHGLTRVPFLRDRLERYLAWYGKYLKGESGTTTQGGR
jgi:dipeptidyl aminopeptidase/acylaminoacyl peptidase